MMSPAMTLACGRGGAGGRRKRERRGTLVCSILHLRAETRQRIADYDPRLWTAIPVRDGHAFPVTALEDPALRSAAPDLAAVLGHAQQGGFRYVVLSEGGTVLPALPLYPA
ncbi:hypothetical protein [Chelatococcus composti]|jgi:hypothetical protein|uniref:DUF5983 domain-containing protein n=1 Tax=Chelatococcus composti TaxID=1743235 RepID=A0A841K3M4_9HYPH|nr:hypothetical protein [Chelatococcus composti]MBB6167097.1 hypothetical protein [Chelatococcus composti]MBS7735307.1 hypothetical protein [Chelatococcus composti]GGG29165.1 hypothetical protein GCM10008026_07130 [Chelatococcus composti]